MILIKNDKKKKDKKKDVGVCRRRHVGAKGIEAADTVLSGEGQ